MEIDKNNRSQPRYKCAATMEWAYLNKIDRSDCILMNYSRSGGYIESAVAPVTGSTIFMRLKQCKLKNAICPNRERLRTATLARVEWCKVIPGEQKIAYGVGLQFFDHFEG